MAEDYFKDKVVAIKPAKDKKISQILAEMRKTGFQGRSLAEAAEVLELMIKDKETTILFGYAASLSTTGQGEIIQWLLENHYIDILVGTGANLSEDIINGMGFSYYQCNPNVDDEKFFKEGFNRYYDLFGKEDDYMKMTELIAEFIITLDQNHKYSSREFLYLFGKWLSQKGIKSIVATAAENNVPVFCPAIIDSPYGDAALIAKSKNFELTLDGVKDYIEFIRLSEDVKDTAVVYIGGGVPKDFIQLFAVTADLLYPDRKVPNRPASQSRKGVTGESYYPHKYAVQITTDSPQWGSLSGCTFDEAVSWGKETKQGRYIQCYCDATIALPIISHALAERLDGKREGRQFGLKFK